MPVYYLETGRGCCLRTAGNADGAHREVLREVGELDGVQLVRKATQQDIDHVRGMGGCVPSEATQAERDQAKHKDTP